MRKKNKNSSFCIIHLARRKKPKVSSAKMGERQPLLMGVIINVGNGNRGLPPVPPIKPPVTPGTNPTPNPQGGAGAGTGGNTPTTATGPTPANKGGGIGSFVARALETVVNMAGGAVVGAVLGIVPAAVFATGAFIPAFAVGAMVLMLVANLAKYKAEDSSSRTQEKNELREEQNAANLALAAKILKDIQKRIP